MALTTSLGALSILLVEPSLTQSALIERMLQHQGVRRVHSCAGGGEALAALAAQPADIVISSLYLPDMAGTDLVAALRADHRFEALPFILISSETRPQRLETVRQSGACSIVAKPFTEQQLARALFAAADYLNPPSELDNAEIEGLRVLLVDDSLASRRHLRRLLEELGIRRISEAENGREAVALLHDRALRIRRGRRSTSTCRKWTA